MRIAIACAGLRKKNVRKQPWRYFYELSKYLANDETHELFILSDCRTELPDIDNDVITVDTIFSYNGLSEDFVTRIQSISPDTLVLNLTPSTFLRGPISPGSGIRLVGIVTGTLYTLQELYAVGAQEWMRNHTYLYRFLAESAMPRTLIARSLSSYDAVVTLTDENKRRLQRYYDEEIISIPVGIDEDDLILPQSGNDHTHTRNKPRILYFTSPLTLRGTDVLVRAFADVRTGRNCELTILSRPDDSSMGAEEKRLVEIAHKNGVQEDFHLESEFLDPQTIRAQLFEADIVALPFKIVLSEVPISLYEAQAMGTPVVSTTVGCLPEIVQNAGLVTQPADYHATADALHRLLANPELQESMGARGRERMQAHPRWSDVCEALLSVIQQ